MSLNENDMSVGAATAPTLYVLNILDKCLMAIIAVVMFSMMAVTFIDVTGRYVFNAPIPGGFELIQFLMPLAMFGALPVITRLEEHIVISVLEGVLGSRGVWLQRFLVLIGCAVVNTGITYVMWLQGVELTESQQMSGFLEWSFAPPAYIISGLSAVTVVIIIFMLVLHVFWPCDQSIGGKKDAI
jgi:TRAP-type C4-dicarboxylate transport system permease small subunit